MATKHRRPQGKSGFTRMEVSLIAALVLLITGAGIGFTSAEDDIASREDAMSSAKSIVNAAADWKRETGTPGCPSISQLFEDRALSKGARTDDPWGQRYLIQCDRDQVTVHSAGSDGRPSTADDIRVSQPWSS